MVSPIVIAGPTASGKSTLAIAVAERIGGELICADSRQVMADMPIGTAGPTAEELARVPHHNYGFVEQQQVYDAGRFIIDADRYVNEIAGRGKTPILVGGTGLYLRAWRYGLSDVPARNEEVRAQLEEEKQRVGPLGLYERLKSVDWDAAQKIAPTDDMRVTRALEIFMLTGERPSELRQSHMRRDPRFVATWILLNPEREWLNQRIAERVTKMFDAGLVEEAVRLKTSNMMGHEEALLFAQGVMTKSEAIERTQIRHRQYAKRQMTWFKKEPWWTSVDLPSEDPIQLAMNIIGTLPTQR